LWGGGRSCYWSGVDCAYEATIRTAWGLAVLSINVTHPFQLAPMRSADRLCDTPLMVVAASFVRRAALPPSRVTAFCRMMVALFDQ
jgi:hypothetical protein